MHIFIRPNTIVLNKGTSKLFMSTCQVHSCLIVKKFKIVKIFTTEKMKYLHALSSLYPISSCNSMNINEYCNFTSFQGIPYCRFLQYYKDILYKKHREEMFIKNYDITSNSAANMTLCQQQSSLFMSMLSKHIRLLAQSKVIFFYQWTLFRTLYFKPLNWDMCDWLLIKFPPFHKSIIVM